MDSLRPGLSATPAALTVELDLNEVAAGLRPPAPLTRSQAERLAEAVGADLRRILGEELASCGMIVPGALYDLTELLRPGLPFIETLLELYRGSLPQGQFRPQVVAIGSSGDSFPVEALAPARRPGSGPLLVMPILFVAPAAEIDRLQSILEEILLEKGTAEPPTEQRLREDFGLRPVNISYATINDLCALLKIQLEHNELGGLWQLLEAVLYRPGEAARVDLPEGNVFLLDGAEVYSPFYSFAEWVAQVGNEGDPGQGYAQWVKRQRQYMAGLSAHGLKTFWVAADPALRSGCANSGLRRAKGAVLPDQELVTEPAPPARALPDPSIVLLSEQATPELGPVAYSVLVQAASGEVLHLGNEYPLNPQAIIRIRDRWAKLAAQMGVELHVARPYRLVTAEDGSDLIPDFTTVGGLQ